MFSTEMESSRGPQSPRTLRASAAPPNISTYSLSVRVSQKQLINEIETCWKGREGGRTKRHQAFERPLEPKEARKHTLMHGQKKRALRRMPTSMEEMERRSDMKWRTEPSDQNRSKTIVALISLEVKVNDRPHAVAT